MTIPNILFDGPRNGHKDAPLTVALAHGAGALMDSPFMATMAGLLAATLAYARLCDHARGDAMTLDLWLAAVTALGLLVYLVAVLLRPEKY